MKKSKILNILLTSVMLLSTVFTPQMSHALASMQADDTDATSEVEPIDADTDEEETDTDDGENVGEEPADDEDGNSDEGNDSAEVTNVDGETDTEEPEDETQPEAEEETEDDKQENPDNNGPPASKYTSADSNSTTNEEQVAPQADEGKDLGSNIFTDVKIELDGNELEEGTTEIEITDGLQLRFTFDWALSDDVDLNAGDWAQIELPDAFQGVAGQTTGNLYEDGVPVGTYQISEDGYLRVEFNHELIDKSERAGEVGFLLEFDLKEFEEDANQNIKFESPINKEFNIKAKPSGEVHDIKKLGKANENINPEYLEWTIDVNTKLENLANATVEDIIPEGLELDFDSIEVYELTVGYEGKVTEGNKIDGLDITEIDSGFKVDLGETDKAYRIKYKTNITEFDTEFTNDAVLKDEGEEKAKDKFTITGLERGSLIEKDGWKNPENKDQVIWQIDVNKSESSLKNVEVLDDIPEGLKIEKIEVWTLNKSGNDWGYGEWVGEYDEFPVDLGDIDDAHRFRVTTNIDYGYFEEYTKELVFDNEAVLKVNGEVEDQDDATVPVERETLLEKNGWESTDYGDSKISWEISVNKAQHTIKNAVIKDTLGQGLELIKDSIEVFDSNDQPVDLEGKLDATADGFTINLGEINSEYKIKYDTKITENLPDGQEGYKNTVGLEGDGLDGVGVEDTTKEPTIPSNVSNKYEKSRENNKEIDGITYDGLNYTEKTMSWKLTVDAIKEEITELTITDSFEPAKSMKFIEDSLRVLKDGEIVPSDQYKLTDKGVDGFELEFNGPLDRAKYEVYFKTSFDPDEVLEAEGVLNTDNEYKNHVTYTGKTKDVEGNEKGFTEKDAAEYNVSKEYVDSGKKSGTLDRENRTISWQIFANATGQNLTGGPFVITDTLTEGDQTLNEDVEVFEYSLDKDGNFIKGTEITEGFVVNYEDPESDFILTFAGGVDRPVLVEFSSKINGISEALYKNKADITDITEQGKTYEGQVEYEGHNKFINKETKSVDNNITYTDDEIIWDISINESLSDIKNAVFTDTISEGLILVNDSIKVYKGSIAEDNEVELDEEEDVKIESNDAGGTDLSIALGDIEEVRYYITYKTVVVATGGKISNEASLLGGDQKLGDSSKKEYEARQSSWGTGSGKENRGQIEVVKVDSNSGEPIASPAKFELYYLLNGEEQIVTGEVQVTEDGKIQYGSLPFRTYYLREVEAPEGYILSSEVIEIDVNQENKEFELSVENIAELEISVEKIWEDANNQDGMRPGSIAVNLLAGEDIKESTKLDADNGWSATFTGLSPIDENGDEIEYTIEEVEVEGYEASIAGTITDGFIITNKYEPELINIEGTKNWKDAENQDGKRPDSITVRLLADGEKVYDEDTKVTAETEWAFEFTDLPKFADGEEIVYTIEEVEVDGYEVSYDGFDITNSYTPEETDVSITKKWDDEGDLAGFRPDHIEVELYADGKATGKVLNIVADENGVWEGSFINLPKYRDGGHQIDYTVKEVSLDEDLYSVEVVPSEENDADVYDFTLINTHEVDRININGTKTWNDADNQDGVRPDSITVRLLANGEKVYEEDTEVTAETEWAFEFTGLPKYADGEEIDYTIKEVEVDGYEVSYDGFDITNSYTPEVTDVSVTKEWNDEDDLAGFRPDHIEVELYADGKATGKTLNIVADEEGVWEGAFINLPKYRDEGDQIDYTVKEVSLDEDLYSVEVVPSEEENTADVYDFTLINTHEVERINLEGTKTWDDADNQDGVRPESITVRLQANGEEVAVIEVTAETEWAFEFTNLPKFADGEEINYTIQEDDVEDYSTEIDGMNITNSYTPGQTSINVVKSWDDVQDKDGIRPDSITVKLFANGKDTGQELVLSAKNNWQGDFTELDEYSDGELIEYTIEEVAVDGYESTITGTSEDGFVITNTHTPEEPETPVDPEDPEKPEEETPGDTDPEDPADSDDDSDLPNAGEAATYTLLALVLVGLGFGLRYYGKRRTN